MLRIEYRDIKDGVEVLRCFGNDSTITLPESIEGKPILKIGNYAFSQYKKKEEEAKSITLGAVFENSALEMIYGDKVREVYLSSKTEEIGKYAFYGCINLEKLGFSDALLRTGTGIFTGCKLKEIRLDLYQGRKSALRDIVTDTRFPLKTKLLYHKNEHIEEVSLIFPEYYEEAVENTPARIIENHFHGTGYKYRQCFFRGEVDYEKYDDLFTEAVVLEDEDIISDIAFGRLLYPYNLTEHHKQEYLDYISSHQSEMMKALINHEDMDGIKIFSFENIWTRECIDEAIDLASAKGKTEILSYLMDEKNRKFSKKKKTFEL